MNKNNNLDSLICKSTGRLKSSRSNLPIFVVSRELNGDTLMNTLAGNLTINESAQIVAVQHFDSLIDSLVTRWKPERQRVAPMSARSMALMGFRCPADSLVGDLPLYRATSQDQRVATVPAVREQS